jgi:hypothetical protein
MASANVPLLAAARRTLQKKRRRHRRRVSNFTVERMKKAFPACAVLPSS